MINSKAQIRKKLDKECREGGVVFKFKKNSAEQQPAEKKSWLNKLTKGLKKDGSVQLVGFGSFAVTKRKARLGHNPQTGAKIKIKASKSVKFRAGKALKDAVKRTKI